MADCENIGLSTAEALNRLHKDLEDVLKEKHWAGGRDVWLRDSLSPCSPHTTLSWPSAVAILLSAFFLIISSAFGGEHAPNFCVGFIVLFLLILSTITALWDGKLRREEVLNRVTCLISSIKRMEKNVNWTEDNYPNLASPTSPCITLQWAWRDGRIVNLPWALLVRDDVILLRPGQVVPGLCVPLDDKNGQTLHAREIYNPQVPRENVTLPAARVPLENKKYQLLETPYTRSIRIILEQSLLRPVSFHDKERHLILTTCIEQTALPLVIVFVVLANAARQFYLSDWFGYENWFDLFLVQPITAGLPLMPLIFPVIWRLVGAWGSTKLRAVLQDTTPAQIGHDPFEDADLEASTLQCNELWRFYKEDIMGRGPLLCRSNNVVHVLGSVTALCCVDKKGVLSWPNPTAEKVFFLRSPEQQNDAASLNSEGYDSCRKVSGTDEIVERDPLSSEQGVDAVPEVLDLTHDHTSPFRLHFDDPSWKLHLSSLKPLGLAILLNTCNANSQDVYSQFCCHLTCEAAQNENLVPVTNRRCLCELAAQIGFLEQAQGSFNLEQMLCTFQHVRPETVKRDIKFARQLSKSTKLKFPFPHMVATVLRDRQTSCLQLMSQGTADVILDSCVEYWDGTDLHPLTSSDRKKILDFYQRTSLTANCTAFAYRPLSKTVSTRLSQVYMEVPSDSRHLYLPYRSPTPLALSLFDGKWRGAMAQFHSSDSLLGIDGKEEEVTDMEGWFELQCNQVFIGMVTMQYQAQADVVHLVEQLERACIRFVHFSKENELRSRVFSEKMGLESGWNCHISLLSDRSRSEGVPSCVGSKIDIIPSPLASPTTTNNLTAALQLDAQLLNERTNLTSSRAMSFSAPSAINMDLLTVKFDEQPLNWPDDNGPPATALSHRERRISQDSVVGPCSEGEQWRSLSCLTDSTDQSVPFAFDISNRAKLPRGIDKIRPHLELIDNVPLLVSLFTDCNPTVTREMLHIMQDYGEVVCVFGSSANCENVGVFLQADASIAVEPLYPQVCQKLPAFSPPTPQSGPSPIELSRALISLPCAVSMRREDPLSMFQLITCARDFSLALRNFLQFWLCSICSLSAVLVFSVVFMLPPPINPGQVLFICCLLIPILSSSLMVLPTDSQVMHKATGKNQCTFNSEALGFVIWCYGFKCLPSVFLNILWHLASLALFSQTITAEMTNSTYSIIFPSAVIATDVKWDGWNQYGYSLFYLQNTCALLFVVHMVFASASYVYRDKLLWHASPFRRAAWISAAIAVLIAEIIFTCLLLNGTSITDAKNDLNGITHPWIFIISALISPLVILAINEAVKWQEMKVNKRFQRRTRLDFGTKLGMNSPF